MYSLPPGFSSLRLPLGNFVIYPTERPSIRTLVRQIEDQGYSVQTYLFPNNKNLRAPPPGVRHWAVVIGDAILVIVPSYSSDSSVDPSDGASSGSASCSSRNSSIVDSDQVDPDFPWLGKG
jgi:hypothetical protein